MMENLMTYLWILVLAFATVMTFVGGLRWIANKNKRQGRLKIISICSLVILVIVLLSYNWGTVSGVLLNSPVTNDKVTFSLINISKITIKVLVIVLIVTFSLILSFMAILLVVYSGKAIVYTISAVNKNDVKQLKQDLQKDIEKITVSLKYPVFIVAIVVGILALYLTLPLAIGGNIEKENVEKSVGNAANIENIESIADRWISGIKQIGEFCTINNTDDNDNDEKETNFANHLAVYTLVFILILGILYASGSILFEIIAERFENKKGFLKEYSNSIGLLAMGISILYLLSSQGINLSTMTPSQLVGGFLESFVLVIFVIALVILTLEIVRLLIDMKEKMLRKEARYLFVLLVGLCTMLIMRVLLVVYHAISSALGRKNERLEKVEERVQDIYNHILEKVTEDMKEEIEVDNRVDGKIPYNTFKGKITRK